jgi:pSer/pThr/pTyr-binding forkhead associated (FHA) protein
MKLVIENREGVRTAVALAFVETTLGRGEGNQVQLDARNVSRRHARLRRDKGGFVLEDLGSFTGVRVNGARIAAPTLVTEDDVIEVGDYTLALAGDSAKNPTGLAPLAPGARPGQAAGRETHARRAPQAFPGPASPLPPLVLGLGALAVLLVGVAALLALRGSSGTSRREPAPVKAEAPRAGSPAADAARATSPTTSATSAADPPAGDAAARKALQEGETRLRAHDAAGAIARFQRAIREKPGKHLLGRAYRGLGMAYVAAGDAKRGAAYLKLYLPLCPASERPRLEEAIARYGK